MKKIFYIGFCLFFASCTSRTSYLEENGDVFSTKIVDIDEDAGIVVQFLQDYISDHDFNDPQNSTMEASITISQQNKKYLIKELSMKILDGKNNEIKFDNLESRIRDDLFADSNLKEYKSFSEINFHLVEKKKYSRFLCIYPKKNYSSKVVQKIHVVLNDGSKDIVIDKEFHLYKKIDRNLIFLE